MIHLECQIMHSHTSALIWHVVLPTHQPGLKCQRIQLILLGLVRIRYTYISNPIFQLI